MVFRFTNLNKYKRGILLKANFFLGTTSINHVILDALYICYLVQRWAIKSSHSIRSYSGFTIEIDLSVRLLMWECVKKKGTSL